MAVTYFGLNEDGTGTGNHHGYMFWNDNSNIVYTCPGVGTQNVVELSVRCYSSSSGDVHAGIYDTAGNLLYQWAAEQACPGSVGWVEDTSFVDKDLTPVAQPTLVGGTAYILASAAAGTEVKVHKNTVTSGWMQYNYADHSDDLPDTLPAGSNLASQTCVRCGVEPAAAGGIPMPAGLHHFRQMIGQ